MPFPAESSSCTSWPVLPLLILDASLIGVIVWRVTHQVSWQSHPRRIVFHVILLGSGVLRMGFWISLCHIALLRQSYALLWFSNSLVLLCTAKIIFQWACAASAGQVTAQEMQRVRTFSLHHPLVLFHTLHVLIAVAVGLYWIVGGPANEPPPPPTTTTTTITTGESVFLDGFRGVANLIVCGLDLVAAMYVTCRLGLRLKRAAMSDEMKRKSAIQLGIVICLVGSALVLQLVLELAVLVHPTWRPIQDLSLAGFCLLKYFVPGFLLSGCFLYVMRRVESRDPARLVVMPTSSSLVAFEECSAKACRWCEQHRRLHAHHPFQKTTTLMSNLGCDDHHLESARTTFQSSSMHSLTSFALLSSTTTTTCCCDWLSPSTTYPCAFPAAPRLQLPPTLSSTTASDCERASSHAQLVQHQFMTLQGSEQQLIPHVAASSSTDRSALHSQTTVSTRCLFPKETDPKVDRAPPSPRRTGLLAVNNAHAMADGSTRMHRRRNSQQQFQVVHLHKEFVQVSAV